MAHFISVTLGQTMHQGTSISVFKNNRFQFVYYLCSIDIEYLQRFHSTIEGFSHISLQKPHYEFKIYSL